MVRDRVFMVPVLLFSVVLAGCKPKVSYPEFTSAQATASLSGYLLSLPISQGCFPVALVSDNDSAVVPMASLSVAARDRQAALQAAGLLRIEQAVEQNVTYRRSTLTYAAYALYSQGTALDFTRLCNVKLQLLGAATVVTVNGHPEFLAATYQVVPAAWPMSMWSPAALPVTSSTGYPRKVTAFFQYKDASGDWELAKSGLDDADAGAVAR